MLLLFVCCLSLFWMFCLQVLMEKSKSLKKKCDSFNPISTERGQIWPGWPNPVWHFHILMVRVTKLHDFVSFYICQVPERSFFEKRKSIFEKSKKMIWQFQHQRVPPLDKNWKKSKFFSFLKKIIILYLNMN